MSLITTITELKQYIAVDGNLKIASILPYIKEAEQLYIVDLLGKDFYDEFLALYEASVTGEAPTPLSADNALLLPYIQRALAYYTQVKAIPHLTVTFGDMGIRQHRGEDSDAAPRWKEEKLLLNALISADTHADKLLEFLEDNATGVNDYATWFDNANIKTNGTLVYSTEIASQYIDISKSRRVFLQLKPTLNQLEKKYVPKLVGQEQYDELVAALIANTITEAQQTLIDLINPIICKRALYMRLPFMRVSIAADGVWLYSDVNEIRSKDFLATRDEVKALRFELMEGFMGYMADEHELKQFILDNHADYPLIEASTAYTVQPDPGPTWQPLNDPNNKFFSV